MVPAAPPRQNRLAGETSPYLLQHANNPVDWYPWGPEALERARREDRPILLSVGYSSCHWCHVMERESFTDPAIAAAMNEHFVCVKVDREERPDLDEIYMAATVALCGSGGWPMTVFLTPDQRPFFAGTYFPPTGRHGRPGFRELLTRIAELWRADRSSLEDQARQLTAHVTAAALPSAPGEVPAGAIDDAVAALEAAFDAEHGGFGPAPKFPPAAALSLLLRHHRRTGQQRSLTMVTRTLDAMKDGGIHDQLGGGFARYSTDERWRVPHFEKMLYDNAALARSFLEAFTVTADPEYARTAAATLDWILGELQGPEGGIASALDADSEGEEGRYYLWRLEEITELLGAEASRRFAAYYAVTADGNLAGKNVLHVPRPLRAVAAELGLAPEDLARSLAESRERLLAARRQRTAPQVDDKVLTSWNGLAIGALAEGARVLGEARFRDGAVRAARFALGHLVRPDGGLYRTWRAGEARLAGYLEDYAFLADGLLDLYEACGDRVMFDAACRLSERLVADFGDPAQGDFFSTARGHEALLVRPRDGHDGALPSANAVAARLLARLSWHLGRPALRARAVRAIRAYAHELQRVPRAFATTLGVVDLLLECPIELVFAGDPADPALAALGRAAGRRYLPNRVIAHALPGEAERPTVSALLEGRPGTGPAMAYVCRDGVCQAPARDPRALATAMDEAERAQRVSRAASLTAQPLAGRATADGTARYLARHLPGGEQRRLGRDGPWVSALGFGAYRVVEQSGEHRAALAAALEAGVNLVDTSTNYGGGSSETLVGQVLGELVASGAVARDEIVVVSKVGYLEGTILDEARSRAAAGDPWPEVVKFDEQAWHCIHPAFLEAELTRSLARLGLETLDFCLLHNPEQFLLEAVRKKAGELDVARGAFYAGVEAAFRHLEREVARGRIAAYGVSSNTLAAPATDPGATDVARLHAAALRAGGERHSFRLVELPLNLLEGGGLGEAGAIATAARLGLGVLVNRPLNAVDGAALLRLSDLPPRVGEAPEVAPRLAELALLEGDLRETFFPRLRTPDGAEPPEGLLAWADRLNATMDSFGSLEQWLELEQRVVRPHTRRVLDTLDRAFAGELRQRWLAWRDRFVPSLEAALRALRERAADRSRERLAELRAALSDRLPPDRRGAPLARLAVWSAASVPGVSSVLVGMRREPYVRALVPLLAWAPLSDPERAFLAAPTGASARGEGG